MGTYTSTQFSGSVLKLRSIGRRGFQTALPSIAILLLSQWMAVTSAGAAEISGTVTGSETTEPVQGIEVCAFQPGVGQVGSCRFSDEQGNYIIDDIEGTPEVTVSTIENATYASQRWPGISLGESGTPESIDLAAGDRNDIDFALVPGFRISGVVTGAGGVTVESFGIQFTRSTAQGRLFIGGGSSPDGSFFSNMMVAGDYKLLVTTHGSPENPDRFVDQLFDGVVCIDTRCDLDNEGTPISLVDADRDVGTVELQPGYVVTGSLKEASTNEPVPDNSVFVQVFDASGSLVTSGGPVDGAYVTGAMPDGEYRVLFNADSGGGPFINQLYDGIDCGRNCDPANQGDPVVLAGADFVIDAVLSEGGTVTGQVTAAETGQAIEGFVELLSTGGSLLRSTVIETDGSYSIEGLDPGDYLVFFESAGASSTYLDQLHDGVTCPNKACDIVALGTPVSVNAGEARVVNARLEQGAVLTGTVTKSGGGSITEGFVELFDLTGTFVSRGALDENGEYSITTVPGSYKVQARSFGSDDGFVLQVFDGIDCIVFCDLQNADALELTSGERVLDFELNPGFRLFGQVVDDADPGIAITQGSVDLYDAAGQSLGGFGLQGDGSWVSPALPAGGYKLVFNPSSDFARYQREIYNNVPCDGFCDLQNQGDVIELVDQDFEANAGLTRQNAIVGQVFNAGTGDPLTEYVSVQARTPEGQFVASTNIHNADGSYTLGLADGEYRLVFRTFAGGELFVDELHPNIPCPSNSCDISTGDPVLLSGGDVQIDAALSLGGTIAGSVVANVDGLPPVDSGFVQLMSRDGSVAMGRGPSATGSFEFVGLPEGEYWLLARSFRDEPLLVDQLFDGVPCPNFDCDFEADGGTPVMVTADETSFADFALEPVPTFTVSGTVTDSTTGEPLSNVLVETFVGGALFDSIETFTDSNGVFTFEGLLENDYAFVFERQGYMTRVLSVSTIRHARRAGVSVFPANSLRSPKT